MSYESSADVDVQGILDQALRDFMKGSRRSLFRIVYTSDALTDAPPELEPTIGIVLLVSENGSCPFRWCMSTLIQRTILTRR
jgi:hypothetical protein